MRLKLIILFTFLLSATLFALEPGQKIPDFTLRDCNGNLHYSKDLCGAEAKGTKLLIIDFFGTNCAPCKKALPSLVKLHEKYKDQGLKMVLISFQDREKNLRDFAEKSGVKFPVLMDKFGDTAQQFMVQGIPRTFIVGADCTLKKQIIGEQKDLEAVLTADIEKAMGEKAGGEKK